MTTVTASAPPQDRSHPLLPLAVLALFAVLAVPIFVRMPLTNDAEVYDLQADIVRRGGVLYRDALEPNLPGVVWVHLAARRLVGESTEALKLFDLALFAGTVLLAARLVRIAGGSRRAATWTVVGLAGFYLSQSEWIHCQRDLWMLLPTLAAISIRVEACHRGREWSAGPRFLLAVLEGAIWGCGVWLKPYIVFPATAVWLTSQFLTRRWSRLPVEVLGLLLGGGLVGAAGVGWMISSGCWAPFLETATKWNPDYFAAGREHWELKRFAATALRFGPWFGLHVVAIVAAVRWLAFSGLLSPSLLGERARERGPNVAAATSAAPPLTLTLSPADGGEGTGAAPAMLALLTAAYVGWLVQSFAFQHLFDYVHAPAVLLATLVLALGTATAWRGNPAVRPAWLAFGVLAVCWSPWVQPARLRLWPVCVNGPITPATRDQLSHFRNPNRQDLARVAEYLTSQGVAGRDVCFYNSDFVGMYRQMGLLPPTRYTYFYETIRFLPTHQDEILRDLAAAPHRFVVTDVLTTGIKADRMDRLGPNGPLGDAKAQPKSWTPGYPWSSPAVFRAGTYLVHRIDGPITALSLPAASPTAAVAKRGDAVLP